MIRFSQLVAEGLETPVTMHLKAGSAAAFITQSEREHEVIIRLILGIQQHHEGSLAVAELEPYSLTGEQLSSYRRKIGIIYSDGGMLSNLNVWENLTLQLAYFEEYSSDEIETRGIEALQKVGYEGSLSVLPGRLTTFQRRQIALARSFLADRDILIYQSLLDGVSHPDQLHLQRLVNEYHRQRAGGRASLFLSSSPDLLTGLELDCIFSRGGASQP